MNNTDRFTGKARAYAQGRPDYPASVVGLLTQESRRENPRLADIGSGTGILSRAMLERGWTVYGVEPMMTCGGRRRGGCPLFPVFIP